METVGFMAYSAGVLHIIAQALMIPVMAILVLLVGYAVYCIGSIIAEIVTERRYYKVSMPDIVNQIYEADYSTVSETILKSALLKTQKEALLIVAGNMGLSEDDLFALARTQVEKIEDRYKKILNRTEQVTKVAPMMGLMCTLIPLGPGIVAMGQGNVEQLSMSLLIAFDGTVAGLVAAVVAMIATGIRKRWYNNYITISESLMTCVLDKASQGRREGIKLPYGLLKVNKELLSSPENNPREVSGNRKPNSIGINDALTDTAINDQTKMWRQ